MTMTQFIQDNHAELDAAINNALTFVPRQASCSCPQSGTDHHHAPDTLNNEERRQWILNDEGLYNWARREGVRI